MPRTVMSPVGSVKTRGRPQGSSPRLHTHHRHASARAHASQHVAEVVVDRVQVQRLGVDGAHLDDEAVGDQAVAERLLGRVRAVPGEMHGLAVALAHARPLGGGERRRQMLDRIGLDQLPQQVALRRGQVGGGEADLLGIGALASRIGQDVAERLRRDARLLLTRRREVAEEPPRQRLLLLAASPGRHARRT